ncbi:MAG: coproporphyrinogen III oxidase family protein, partial [Treponema sp.]|nr:coproporphyrinogen III oxidase family protein [Treponema sp.]
MEVALYIHIPYCVTKCAYCDFFSTGGNHSGVPERYLSALFAELSFRARQYAVTAWRTVYVGGGTPSLLSADQVTRLFAHLAAVAPFLPQAELTVEANPADITEAFLAALTAAGVTRLSCGVQSFSDTVLQAVNRRSDAAAVERALTTIERHWRGELSVDMISGLPDEDTDGFLRGLGRLCALRPEHMSLYALTLEPGTPLSDAVCSGRRAYDYDAADEQWLSGRDFLTEQGYTQYEVSNFCLPSGECV